jgi:DNA-binding transcriptional LysR family regulator
LAQETESNLHQSGKHFDVHLRIGTHESISIYFFPYFLGYLNSISESFQLALKTGRSRFVIDLIKKGEIDVGISVNPPNGRGLFSVPLFEDQFNFYALPSARSDENQTLILMPDALEISGNPLENIIKKKIGGRKNLSNVKTMRLSGPLPRRD